MKNSTRIILLFSFPVLAFSFLAQESYQDVVYLKNGSIIRGALIDGYMFVFSFDEIDKITREKPDPQVNLKEEIS